MKVFKIYFVQMFLTGPEVSMEHYFTSDLKRALLHFWNHEFWDGGDLKPRSDKRGFFRIVDVKEGMRYEDYNSI